LVSWREDDDAPLQVIISQAGSKDTTLTGYFKANAKHPAARDLLYQDMPLKFTWSKSNRTWSPRKKNRHFCLGQMYYAHPSSGERFYLQLILTAVKGMSDFKSLHMTPFSLLL
jgi:hypothetical protein